MFLYFIMACICTVTQAAESPLLLSAEMDAHLTIQIHSLKSIAFISRDADDPKLTITSHHQHQIAYIAKIADMLQAGAIEIKHTLSRILDQTPSSLVVASIYGKELPADHTKKLIQKWKNHLSSAEMGTRLTTPLSSPKSLSFISRDAYNPPLSSAEMDARLTIQIYSPKRISFISRDADGQKLTITFCPKSADDPNLAGFVATHRQRQIDYIAKIAHMLQAGEIKEIKHALSWTLDQMPPSLVVASIYGKEIPADYTKKLLQKWKNHFNTLKRLNRMPMTCTKYSTVLS